RLTLACPAAAWRMTCKRPRSSSAITMMGTACAWGGMVAARATYVGSPRRISVNTSVSKAFIAGTQYRACDRPPDKCRAGWDQWHKARPAPRRPAVRVSGTLIPRAPSAGSVLSGGRQGLSPGGANDANRGSPYEGGGKVPVPGFHQHWECHRAPLLTTSCTLPALPAQW